MPAGQPFKLFIIYAREDQPALLELKAHLRPLEKRGDLTVWYDGEILPGQEWGKVVKEELEASDIVLLLISKDFFASDYIESKELDKALERYRKGQSIIVPVIVKSCVWDAHPKIADLQALPKDAKPVLNWKNVDKAWESVVRGVLRIIEQRGNKRKKDIYGAYEMDYLSIQILKQIEANAYKKTGLTGVPSGFFDLDRLTSGWQPDDLIIVAARPGMGKSAIMLSFAFNAAKDFGIPVAFFALEMSSLQLTSRLISMEADIESSKMRNGRLEEYEWQALQSATEKLSTVPIYTDDTPGINIFELRSRCRQLKMQHGIQLIIIDHLQLITTSSKDNNSGRTQEIAVIVRGLKSMAKELNVPVIASSQLSRAVETRGGSKRPQLSDLREFDSIEQNSDMVAFLYRPEYYQILEDETGQDLRNVAEFIVAKNRHGTLDTIKLKFIDYYAKFTNLDDPVASTPLEVDRGSRLSDEDIPF